MDRIDRLIAKVVPKPSPIERLKEDNPYIDKSCDELLDYMSSDNYRAPPMRTPEWDKFIFALMHAESNGGLTEVGYSVADVMWIDSSECKDVKIPEDYVPYVRSKTGGDRDDADQIKD